MPWKYSDPIEWEKVMTAEDFPIGAVSSEYIEWMKHNDYSILEHKETHKTITILQTKRGNKSYAKAQKKRLEPINGALSNFKFDLPDPLRRRNFRRTRMLYITLTSNPVAGVDVRDAWLNLKGHESALNKFNAQMKRIFSSFQGKEVRYATHARREAHGSGYPHVHMIVILDHYIDTQLLQSKKPNKLGKRPWVWRVSNRDYAKIVIPLKEAWSRYHISGSNVDVQCVVGNKITENATDKDYNVMSYLMKYVTKDVDISSEKAVYTHAMMKFFNLRDIFSKSFQRMIGLSETNTTDVRHDITITEFKQRIKETKRRIEKTKEKIAELEGYRQYFGYLLSPRKTELENAQQELIELEGYLINLQAELKKLQPEEVSEWEYKRSVTLCSIKDITNFFLWLEEYNTNPSGYNQDFLALCCSSAI